MKNLQKMGGVAALYEAAAYVVGMVGFLLVADVSGVADPVQKVALMVDNQAFLTIMHLIVYVVWGVFLVVLALALYERLKAGSPAMAQTATAFGLIWAGLVIASGTLYNVGMGTVVDLYAKDAAQAATVWLAIDSVYQGLSGVEIVGGTWMLLISWAALRGGGFPKALAYLGMVVGVAGLLTAVPVLEMLAFVFGLGQIVWFVWLGFVMLRNRPSAAA
ncbi:DUF4386 family protein [Chloroflexota bacterium]